MQKLPRLFLLLILLGTGLVCHSQNILVKDNYLIYRKPSESLADKISRLQQKGVQRLFTFGVRNFGLKDGKSQYHIKKWLIWFSADSTYVQAFEGNHTAEVKAFEVKELFSLCNNYYSCLLKEKITPVYRKGWHQDIYVFNFYNADSVVYRSFDHFDIDLPMYDPREYAGSVYKRDFKNYEANNKTYLRKLLPLVLDLRRKYDAL